jgi:hypothetical protein
VGRAAHRLRECATREGQVPSQACLLLLALW